LLEKLRSQSARASILSNTNGKPLSLDLLNTRVMAPAMKKAGITWRANDGSSRKFMFKTTAVLASCLLLVGSMASLHAARDQPNKGSREDNVLFLVARPELRDPIFKESVVLMFPSSVGAGEGLVVGLIINKPARVALSEIFPNDKALENCSETAYFGGPVDHQALGVVFRSSKAAKQGALLALLFDDVYVSFDADFIKGLLKEPKKTPDLRLFVGRSEWSPSQLQNEMFMKAWYGVWAGKNLIFSPSPQSLWRKLVDRAESAPVAERSQTCLLQPRLLSGSGCRVGVFPEGKKTLISGATVSPFGAKARPKPIYARDFP
jgi:putative transcriptional regulator